MNNAPTQAPGGDEETATAVTPAESETPKAPPGDALSSRLGRLASRLNTARKRKAVSQETRREQERLLRVREEQERQETQQRASLVAKDRRRAASRTQETVAADDEIAPMPIQLQILAVWFNRSFGALPLIAPLFVSAVFTVKSGTADPMNLHWSAALALALAFEGGIWKAAVLYEKTRIEGDSTVGHRLLIGLLILLNAAFILSHSLFELLTELAGEGTAQIDAVTLTKWAPALIVALMSTIGVLIWGKQATYKHRARLREQGLVDSRSPKFSTMSWILCPWDTWWALRHATRYRITSPILAIEDRRLWRMSGKPEVWPPVETVEAELVEAETSRPVTQLRSVSSRPARETLALSAVPATRHLTPSPETLEETESGDDRLLGRVASLRSGTSPVSYAEIAKRLGISKAHAGRLGVESQKRGLIRPGDEETAEAVAN